MNMENECIVTGYFALTLKIAKYIGLAPLRIKKTDKGLRISPSMLCYVIGCVAATIKGLLVMWGIILDLALQRNHLSSPVTRRLAILLEVASVALTCVLTAYTSLKQIRCIITALSQLQQIGNMLKIPNLQLSRKKKQMTIIVVWGIIGVLVSLHDFIRTIESLSFSHFNNQTTSIWTKSSYFMHYSSYFYIQLEVLIFAILVLHIRSIFQAVNMCFSSVLKEFEHQQQNEQKIDMFPKLNKQPGIKILKKVNNYVEAVQESAEKISGDRTKILPHETIHHIASAYSSVCETVRIVDESYGFQLILLLSLFFLRLVTAPYYFIKNLFDEEKIRVKNVRIFISKEMSQLFWIICHVVNLAALIEPCHLTHMETEATRELVGRLMVHAHSVFDPMAVELEQFYRQLMLNDVSFRPMKVLTLSRELLLTVLGSITTYLVILIDIKY